VIWAWVSWREGLRLAYDGPPTAWLGAALAGFVCYFIGTNLDFRALTLVDASVERVLLFAYPSMVVVLHALIYRQRPTPRAIASLTCTYAGILMVVSGFDLRILRTNIGGAGLVLGCALTYALYYLASDRWGARIGAMRFTLAAVTTSAAAFALQYFLTGTERAVPAIRSTDVTLIAAMVMLSTVLPMVLTAEGVRRLGAPRAAVICNRPKIRV
jgi:drug/metabolite transporter (DMT)-like permease